MTGAGSALGRREGEPTLGDVLGELEKERDKGRVRKPGQRWKVGPWLEHWVKNIAAPPTVSENTQAGYEVDVRRHLVPGVGEHWLVKLDAEHLEKLYAKLLESGLSPGTVNHIHRTIALRSTRRFGAATWVPIQH